MGKLALSVASKTEDLLYVHIQAETPAFSAKASFYCKGKSLVEFGKKLKGFPKSVNETLDFPLGESKRKTEFHFKTVGTNSSCELWIKIIGTEDEHGKSAEAYFPIDYLEPLAIDNFSKEMIKLGTGLGKSAEIKNKFED